MPRFKVEGFGNEAKEAEAGTFEVYDGELPPKNSMLRVKVKQLKLKINKKGSPMLNCVVEVDMPDGHKLAKYNKCPAWWNGNITKEGAGFINAFLRSIAGSEAKGKRLINDFWDKGMNLSGTGKPTKESPCDVKAIGQMVVDPEKPLTGYILSKTKNKFGGSPGEKEMDIARWVLPKSAIEGPAVDADGDEIEEVEEEDGVEVEQEEDGDVDEEAVDEDDSEIDDEPPF